MSASASRVPATSTVPSTRASLLVLGLAAFMVQADARVIDPLLHVIASEFKTSLPAAAIVISSYALPYGLFQLLYGQVGDRIGKIRVIAMCLAVFSFGTFACAFVPNVPVFATLRFLTGVAAAAVVPMSLGHIGDTFPYQERQIALARFMSALMIGQIVGSTLGGIFGEYLGWRYIFIVFGIVSLVVSAMIAREGRRFAEHRTPERRLGAALVTVPIGGLLVFAGLVGVLPFVWAALFEAAGACLLMYALATQYGALFTRPSAPLVLGTVLVEGLFVFGGLAYLASSLTDRFGINYAYAGLMVAGFGCGGLIYSASAKKLVTGAGELGVLLLGGTLLGVAFVFIALLPSWIWFVPAVIVLGMGYYTMHGTLQTRATELAPQARGTAISLFAFFFFVGQAIGPQLLGSILKARGYTASFIVAGVGLFVTASLSRMLFLRSKPTRFAP
jgi:predicted MFS family arabinose efflux permease